MGWEIKNFDRPPKRRMTRAKGCLVLFIISVIAGTLAGYYLINGMESPDEPQMTTLVPNSPLPTSSTDPKRSVLVLGVDSLDKRDPALEGAWLITLIENAGRTIHLRVATLYPVVEASMTSNYHYPYTQPHPPIIIDPHDLRGASNLAPISFTYDKWSQVILLDEVAINTLIMMQNLNFRAPAPTPGPGAFIKPWEKPQQAFEQQERILSILCDNPAPLSDPNNINTLMEMEGRHLFSTLPEGGLRSLWQLINYIPSKQVTCTRIP
jgi:hypothetical protein